MPLASPLAADQHLPAVQPSPRASAVAWGSIAAGAAAAASLSLILLILGVGLGLSSVSPWAGAGVSAAAFGVSTILWLAFTQLAAAAMGGYLAGRLRHRWADAAPDEVYFRDTAHGFLAWAVASLATAALLTSTIASIVGGGVQAGALLAGAAGTTAVGSALASPRQAPATEGGPMGYFVDSLFRRDAATGTAAAPITGQASSTDATANTTADGPVSSQAMAEVQRIFMHASRSEPLPGADLRHVGQLVARHTGLSQQDAEKRAADVHARLQASFTDTETAARNAADKARKASARSALWLFVSLLAGAFVASLAATFGGRRRDA
ncbi:MAG: hypothetical protein V4795_20020 [Pseudomonadota bacterium]